MPEPRDADPGHPSRSRRVLRVMRSHVQPGSFPLLLIVTLTIYVLNGAALDSSMGAILAQIGRVGIAVAGLYVLSSSRPTLYVGLAVLVLLVASPAIPWPQDPNVRIVEDSLTVGFLTWVLAVVLREVFRSGTTERDAVIGALAGFLLLVTIFMRAHALLEALAPGSYSTQGPPLSERSDAALIATFQYFSTVTQTTVGFGDIVPVAPAARLVTGLQAILGQLYLAVVVATLVGRAAARRE